MEPLQAFVIIVLTFLFSELRNPPANDYDIQQENMNAKYISFSKMDQQPYDKLPRGKRGQKDIIHDYASKPPYYPARGGRRGQKRYQSYLVMPANRIQPSTRGKKRPKRYQSHLVIPANCYTTQHQREEEAKKISYSVYKVNNKILYTLPRQLR